MYAESTPLYNHQKTEELADRAKGYAIEGVSVDGNDVFEIYDAAYKAVNRARKGKGPTLMNCRTYRILGHYVGDSGSAYRSKSEVEEAKKKDPVERFRKKLFEMEALTEEKVEQINKEIDREIEEAVEFARESPEPTTEELMKDVYSSD
jgi:pyruvate dehydrogenase E1 component alpha subunit